MPLERFIPKSPDPFIRNSQDFEVAKFGHLNTIIEYINTYVAADSLQLAGTGPLTSVARYITDPLGNTSTLAISTTRVGIGTNTPVNLLSVDATNSTLTTEHSAAAVTIKSTVQSPLRVLRTGGQPNVWIGTSNTTPNASSFLFGIRTGAYYNTATPTYSGDYAAWIVYRGNDWGAATLATDLRMSQVFTCNGNNGRAALAIYPIPVETATNTDMVNMNNLLIATAGAFTAQPIARLQIIGDGSTSATTSLLVQNSAGTNLLTVLDNGNVGIGTTTPTSKLVVANTSGALDAVFTTTDANSSTTIYEDNDLGKGIRITSYGSTASGTLLDGTINRAGSIVLRTNDTSYPMVFGGISTSSTQYYFGRTGFTLALNTSTNNVTIGASSGTARLQIVGSGSTSATTSLLVQNSAGTNLLQQKDNGELWIGTTASGLGRILVPHDSAYGQRVFMGIQAGVNLMATQSNDGLVFKANYNIFDGSIFNNSGTFFGANTGVGTDTSAYNLATQLNPYGAANSNLINLSGGGRLQGGASGNYIQVSGNMQVDSSVNILRGFYFNPTLSGAYSNANVFAVHSTYGGAYLNTATPNASAILQADSTTQGFLPPRMTTAQRTAIVSPAAGLIVYDTTTNKSYTYDGTAWQAHY